MNLLQALEKLDSRLHQRQVSHSLVPSLILQGMVTRDTQDVDVLSPVIDSELDEDIRAVAGIFQLDPKWVNNGPSSLADELPEGWQNRTIPVFKGKSLHVFMLGQARDDPHQGLCLL